MDMSLDMTHNQSFNHDLIHLYFHKPIHQITTKYTQNLYGGVKSQ